MKKILSLILAFVMVFSLLPVNALAAEDDAVPEDVEEELIPPEEDAVFIVDPMLEVDSAIETGLTEESVTNPEDDSVLEDASVVPEETTDLGASPIEGVEDSVNTFDIDSQAGKVGAFPPHAISESHTIQMRN